MKVAVLCGDRWHPAEVIREGLAPLNTGDLSLTFWEDTHNLSLERMSTYDVLVLCKGNGRAPGEEQDWLTESVQQKFREVVTQGGGLLVCHSGTVGYTNEPDFRALVGGVFTRHPQHCPVTLEYLGDFGLMEGDPTTIQIHDEHYFVDTADDITVFLQSSSENGTQPAGWTRHEGKGRVCVLTPGHFADVWAHSVYQHTLQKAMTWCARK